MLTVTTLGIPGGWEEVWAKASSSLSLIKHLFVHCSALVLCWVQPGMHSPVLVWLTQEDIHTLLFKF